MRKSYEALKEALDKCEHARACIAQNRGPEKDEARDAYSHVVGEELVPALLKAVEDLAGDIQNDRKVESLARSVMKLIENET